MSVIRKAMFLAAGFGQRARPLSLVRPKPLFPVLNRPLIELNLELAARAGVAKAVVNIHHLGGMVEDYLAGIDLLDIKTVVEPGAILGTGGGIKNAEAHLGPEPFFVIKSTVHTNLDLAGLAEHHFTRQATATLALHHHPDFNNVAVGPDGLIRGFRGQWADELGLRVLAFTGFQIAGPELLSYLPSGPSDLILAYQAMIQDGLTIAAHTPVDLVWHDSGTLERYLALHAGLLGGKDQPALAAHPGALVDREARIEGWACLGSGACVEAGATIKNSVLWPEAVVGAGVRVEDSVLTDGARLTRDAFGRAVLKDRL